MSAVLKPKVTPLEYLERERVAPFKSEYLRGEVFAMAGASPRHNFIKENISIEVGRNLRSKPCRGVSSDQRVYIDRTGLYTYPDYLIVCGELELDAVDTNAILNPSLIIEILSPSTEKYDRGMKFRHYQQIPSLKEYVLVEQDEPLVDRYVRLPDETWALKSFVGKEAVLELATVPIRVPLADLYAGVEFDQKS